MPPATGLRTSSSGKWLPGVARREPKTICTYIVNEKPQPPDYATRYPGRVRLVIKLSTDNVVKSAHAIVEATDKTFICPPKR